MKHCLALLACLTALLPPLTARAQPYPAFSPPGDFVLQAPAVPPSGQPAAYGGTGPGAGWAIAQWGTPAKLPPFTATQQGGAQSWTAASAAAAVTITRAPAGAARYTLSQNGAGLACGAGAPREFDLFASPRHGLILPPGQAALTALTQLRATATVSFHYAGLQVAHSCGVSQGGLLIAVILSDPTAHQTLFYQLALGGMCGPQPEARAKLCESWHSSPVSHFFFSKNPFGVDESLPLLGQPWLGNNQTRAIDVDLLPRLLGVINTGPPAMDHDPAHWRVTSYYNGQHIWGGVTITSVWRDVGLQAYGR